MTEYMLMFSLGPVQTFIAQARKTRDLWQGSFLVSKLMEAGMKGIASDALIFPTRPVIEHNIPDLPNKFVAIFETEETAQVVAQRSKKQIVEFWQGICDDIWEQILKHSGIATKETGAIWGEQTNPEKCFEIYWVVVKRNTGDYGQWLTRTRQALDARKRLRNFPAQDEPGEKSTISGEREALHGVGEERQDVRTFWYTLTQRLSPKDISQDGTERLDAIDTVKRFAFRSSHLTGESKNNLEFPTTSSIATAPFVARLLAASVGQPLSNWLTATKALDNPSLRAIPYLAQRAGKQSDLLKRDGDGFFLETFTPRRLHEDYGLRYSPSDETVGKETKELAEKCRKATNTLLRATDALELPRPTPYYAVVQMDGDRMGKLIGDVKEQPEHQAISAALSAFSREDVPRLVEQEHPARLVYAGGDDVLALSPLEGVFELASALQAVYCQKLSAAVQGEERQKQVTASMGIAIAHHLAPLSFVLRAAHEAEHLAKSRYERDALVVTVIRRSGEHTCVGCHWRYAGLSAEAQPLDLLVQMYRLFDQNRLSSASVFHLLEEVATLIGLESAAQQSEIKRVLRRQWSDNVPGAQRDRDSQLLAGSLVSLAQAMDRAYEEENRGRDAARSAELRIDERRYGLVETLGWMLVAAFLARKGLDA